MSRNTVNTVLTAENRTGTAFAELDRSLRNATITGNLMATGITAGLNVIGSAVSKLVGGALSSLNSAFESNLNTIGSTGDVMKLTGLSFQESSEYIETLRTDMAKLAAALPGQTSDYVGLAQGIQDNLIPAFRDLNGAIDLDALTQANKDIAKFGALRANFSGIETKDASLAISKALAGASISELRQLRFFESNPAVLAFIESELDSLGKDLKDLSAKERFDVLRTALEVDDEVIKAASTSATGLIEGFKSQLFDPDTGVFGFLRKFKFGGQETSIIVEAGKVLNTLLSEGGILSTVGSILSSLGFKDTAVLEGITTGFRWMDRQLNRVNRWLQNLQTGLLTGFNSGRSLLQSIRSRVPNLINALIDKLRSGLDALPLSQILEDIISGIGTFLSSIDWGKVGATTANILNLIREGLIQAVQALSNTMATIDWRQATVRLMEGVGHFIGGFFQETEGRTELYLRAINLLGQGLRAVMGIFIGLLQSAFMLIWEGIKGLFSALSNTIADAFEQVINTATSAVGTLMKPIQQLIDGIKSFFSNALGWIQGQRLEGTANTGLSTVANISVTNRASGNITDLIRRELRMSPTGALPVVANDSELILNRSQQANLINSLNKQQRPSIQTGDIHIVSSATDPREVAQQVINQLNTMIKQKQALGYS